MALYMSEIGPKCMLKLVFSHEIKHGIGYGCVKEELSGNSCIALDRYTGEALNWIHSLARHGLNLAYWVFLGGWYLDNLC